MTVFTLKVILKVANLMAINRKIVLLKANKGVNLVVGSGTSIHPEGPEIVKYTL